MPSDFFAMDLHIHTPASTECFRGRGDDNDYFDILKQCINIGLSIIAITDHNTISGYKKILAIKDSLIAKLKDFQSKDPAEQDHKEINSVQKYLAFFDDIMILPGVEFETRNNIHILLLFNPAIPIMEIEAFLLRGGYAEANQGSEIPPVTANWDVLDLFENAKVLDCIIIDAHTDSDKGLFNLPRGSYRAKCFKSDLLSGVCYKNENQRFNIEKILSESPDYRRNRPLAFIKASDAHSVKEVGRSISWIKLDQLTFEHIKDAFANPIERISIESPKLAEILKKLLDREDSYGITDVTDANKFAFQQLICAINNSNGGYCLIGVDEKKRKIGVDIGDISSAGNRVRECLDRISAAIKDIVTKPKIGINIYPIQKSKIIISLNIKNSGMLASIKNDNKIYSLVNRQVLTLDAKGIQSLIEERQAKIIGEKIERNVKSIRAQCDSLMDTIEFLSIVKKYEEKSTLLSSIIEGINIIESIKLSDRAQNKILNEAKIFENGHSKGNITVVNEILQPRLKDAYLRYSLPRYFVREAKSQDKRETIYLFPGGATFYSDKERPIFSSKGYKVITFRSRKQNEISDKFIVAFLKSSFWIWYSLFKLEENNLYRPEIFDKCRIPIVKDFGNEARSQTRIIENRIDDILRLETTFLKKNIKKRDENIKVIDEHNRLVDKPAYLIDRAIYEIIGLSDIQIEKIEGFLRINAIYLPGKSAGAQRRPIIASIIS